MPYRPSMRAIALASPVDPTALPCASLRSVAWAAGPTQTVRTDVLQYGGTAGTVKSSWAGGVTKRGRIHAALPGQMGGAAPGRCSDCGNDAYIQLAGEAEMVCAHWSGKDMGSAPAPRLQGRQAAP